MYRQGESMEEYVTITDGAKQLGVTTKRIQRAIRAGELSARYPYPNKAEIATTDLRAWYAELYLRGAEVQDRLKALESRVTALESQLAAMQINGTMKKALPKPDEEAPEGFTYLSDFCTQHHVPYQAAADLFPRAIHGQKIKVGRRNQPVIGPKGRHDFYVQLHTRDDYVTCDDCPHEQEPEWYLPDKEG
jgi:hypothetical protein